MADEEAPAEPPPLVNPRTFTISLESATALFEVDPEADPPEEPATTSASFTFGAEDEATESEPVVAAGEENGFTYNIKKDYSKEYGIDLFTELLNTPVCVTIYNCAGGNKVPICSATLDVSSLVNGEIECGGEVLLQELPQEEGAPPLKMIPEAKCTVTCKVQALPPAADAPADAEAPGPVPIVTKEEFAKAVIVTVRIPEAVPCPPEMLEASQKAEGAFLINTGIQIDGRVAWCKGGKVVDDTISWEAAPVERFWLPEEAAEALKHKLRPVNMGTRPGGVLSVEVGRYLSPDKEELTDQFWANYHGVAKLKGHEDLVEPGQTKVAVTACLQHWQEGAETWLPVPEYPGSAEVPEELPEPGLCPWVHYQTSLKMEITLSRPLVAPWEAPPTPQLTVKDLLPKHPPPVMITPKEAAKAKFRDSVKSVIANLADEYSAQFPGTAGTISYGDDAKRKKFVFELNRSGAYFHLKEKLKDAVIAVVKEVFASAQDLTPEEKKTQYDDLYVFLVDEMHSVLRGLSNGTSPFTEPAKPPVGDRTLAEYSLTKLKKLADEFEVNAKPDMAKMYHQQRCVLAPADVEVWYDLGAFCMRNDDIPQAEEALREGLLQDGTHFPSLLALTMLLLSTGEYAESEVFAQSMMASHGSNVLVWMLLTLQYTITGKEKEMINAEYEMNRLIKAELPEPEPEPEPEPVPEPSTAPEGEAAEGEAAATPAEAPATPAEGEAAQEAEAPKKEHTDETKIDPVREALSQKYFLELAIHMLDHHVGNLAANVLNFVTDSVDTKLCLARAAMIQHLPDVAMERILEALQANDADFRIRELLGHLHYEQGRLNEAMTAYQITLDKNKTGCTLSVYLRLGKVYLELEMYEEARRLYEVACEVQPCASAWLGAGIANYRIGNLSIAEECLSEANLHDYLSPFVWGYLAAVLLEMGRLPEAEQALAEAYKGKLDDSKLLAEIGRKYFVKGMHRQALDPLRLGLKYGAEPATQVLVGDTLTALKKYGAAKEEYLAALEADSSVEGQQSILKSLISLCTEANEPSEAKMYSEKLAAL